MREAWLVAKHEFLNLVRRRAFLLGTLGVPVLLVGIIGISIVLATGGGDAGPLGYVDLSNTLRAQPPPAGEDEVELRAFPDEQAARQALEQGTIQAFYLLPADYQQTGRAVLTIQEGELDGGARRRFQAFLKAGLLAGQPGAVQQRIADGVDITIQSPDGRREFSESGIINIILPFVAGFFFVYAVLASSGYLLQAVTAEKENRTVEIMATSLTPLQLMGGKALGLIAVALVQLLVWVLFLVIGIVIGAQYVEEIRAIQVPWSLLGLVALYFIPSYALMAGIMTAVGAAVPEMQQGQQFAGILNLLFVLPFFFLVMIFSNPNSPLAVILSLFPTTAFLTVTMRSALTAVPAWQIVIGWVLLVTSALFMVWAASRVFRVGMLRYGQRLELASILGAIRGGRRA